LLDELVGLLLEDEELEADVVIELVWLLCVVDVDVTVL
jgi:hypothetical protein